MQAIDPPRMALAIAAAALAGYVDAVGFISAGGYFVSFMSGNTTRLGVDLVSAPGSATFPALLIAGFFAGVFGGAILAAKAEGRRKPVVLFAVALLLGMAALANLLSLGQWQLLFLVLAMGALNNTFQRDGSVSVGLTYMTGALVRAAQGLAGRVTGSGGEGWAGWLLLWLGLCCGAICGASMQSHFPDLALVFAAGWAGILAVSAYRITAR